MTRFRPYEAAQSVRAAYRRVVNPSYDTPAEVASLSALLARLRLDEKQKQANREYTSFLL